jgi:hypothetical protein
MTYFHPSDFDPGQPVMDYLPPIRKWKNGVNLKGSFSKFQKYLSDFKFINVYEAEKIINWGKAKCIELK